MCKQFPYIPLSQESITQRRRGQRSAGEKDVRGDEKGRSAGTIYIQGRNPAATWDVWGRKTKTGEVGKFFFSNIIYRMFLPNLILTECFYRTSFSAYLTMYV